VRCSPDPARVALVPRSALDALLALEAGHDPVSLVPDAALLLVVLIGSSALGTAHGGLEHLQVEYATRHVRGRGSDYVLHEGHVEESGAHDELMARGGR
jgi:hypothetical protein